MITILVCGGRTYHVPDEVFRVLDELREQAAGEDLCIMHGGAHGADSLAGKWAQAREIEEHRIPARWSKYGKPAGHKRNLVMIQRAPDIVVAFPGGAGTAGMRKLTEQSEFGYDVPYQNGEAAVYLHTGLA